jgi:cellulose synthase/poly-beta-1,6-N-acetylglucosamine synthase-like glycosyltransferase
MIAVLQLTLDVVESILAFMVGYLLLLTAAACLARRRTSGLEQIPDRRFAILIPAHDEERLLPSLLQSLAEVEYPSPLFSVHVVADNCTDRTVEFARQAGARVYERIDLERQGKGYALEWLIEQLQLEHGQYDAIVILDADSIVSKNFLSVMAARLARGEQAIQAYYAVRDPASSWSTSLRAVALSALHYLRPLGRSVLGGSTGLKGNGMVFAAPIIELHRWTASLTEDIEYHMALILAGHRVTFAPDAIVWAEMPSSLAGSQTQNIRWERGRQEMLRYYVPRLLRAALAKRSFLLLDAAIEQLIPPFSIVAAASVVCLVVATLLHDMPAVWAGLVLVLGQVLYTLVGLWLTRVPWRVYQALLYAPIFIIWKVWIYTRVSFGLDQKGWIRTARNDT